MKIIRKDKKDNFTTIDNAYLQNKKLSFKAKGIMTYILSLPDDWVIYIDQLIKTSKDGEGSFRSGLDELIKAGYIKRYPIIEKGQIVAWQTEVYENIGDTKENKLLGKNPNVEKRDVENTEKEKKKPKNTKNTAKPKENQLLSKNPHEEKPQEEKPNLESEDLEKPNLENPTLLNTNKQNTNYTNNLDKKKAIIAINKLWMKQRGTLKDELIEKDTSQKALDLLEKYGKDTMTKAILNTNRLAYMRKNKISLNWFVRETNFRRAAYLGR